MFVLVNILDVNRYFSFYIVSKEVIEELNLRDNDLIKEHKISSILKVLETNNQKLPIKIEDIIFIEVDEI